MTETPDRPKYFSSPELRASIVAFMGRADEIVDHPSQADRPP
jgi:hypothetical protein